jgi:hypothetical protein
MKPLIVALPLLMAACAPEPFPLPPQPPVIITRTIVVPAPLLTKPGTRADKLRRAYRQEERSVKDAVSYPNATAGQIRDIYEKERAAHAATQRLITKDGRSTKADEDQAHKALDDLHDARKAPEATKDRQ